MTILIDNWYVVVGIVALLIVAGLCLYRFFKLPTAEQLKKVREWLVWAVIEAERDLGSGVGKLKLRKVYDLFISKFPDVSKVLTFDMFSDLVDDALEEMKKILENNVEAQRYVLGDKV